MHGKVGIGIIGTGFARKVQIPAFLACKGVFIASVASGHIENASAVASETGAPHFTDDWRETVRRDDVDLVCVTTPPVYHREMTLAALENGKHVLCEKPMAMSVAEAEEMTAAAEKAGVINVIDHELRFLPGRRVAYQMIRDGVIGKIHHAKTNFQSSYRADPDIPWNWWADITSGGGALGAIASHVIDSLHWFMGTTISEINCQLERHVKERKASSGQVRQVTSDDQSNMIVRFADGKLSRAATGLISVSMSEGPEYQNQMEFFGEKGVIRIGPMGEVWIAKNGENEWTSLETDLGHILPGMPDSGFSRGFVQLAPLVVEAIRSGENSVDGAATFADGVAIQRVLDAARLSDAERREITV